MLTKDEKEYLKAVVKQDLEKLGKGEKVFLMDMSPSFLKGEHEYKHFLEELLKKLE